MSILDRFGDWLIARALKRKPDFIIGDNYLRRWWLIPRNRWFNVYLHEIIHDDDDRALHDHPWWNVSVLLRGAYREILPNNDDRILAARPKSWALHWAPRLAIRRPTDAHRIEILDGPVWSLFITGPRIREWGFHCPQGFVGWEKFTKAGDYGQMGKGCDQ